MSALFEHFLVTLAPLLGFSSLVPDKFGVCKLIVKEGEVPILFEFDEQVVPNAILASSPLIAIPEEYRAAVGKLILETNHAISEVFSLKPGDNHVYLHERFHPQIDPETLGLLIHQYLDHARHWRHHIQQVINIPPEEENHPGASSHFVPPFDKA